MSSPEELRQRDTRFPWGILAAAVLLMALALARFVPEGDGSPGEQAPDLQQTARPEVTQTTAYTGPVTEFPCLLADGSIQVRSLFAYSGPNPDCGSREGTDIAALRLCNLSGSFLTEGTLTAMLQDGTALEFFVTTLPPGGSALVFSRDNHSLAAEDLCRELSWEGTFDPPREELLQQLTVLEEGCSITVTNTSGRDLNDLVVHCRSRFGDDYFGGVTYTHSISHLPAGGTVTVEAWECLPGTAEAVRITANES